jgi:vitamin B12 transporter
LFLMTSRTSKLRWAALPLALCAALPATAQTQLKDVVVTATRTAQALTDVVADVSIIDRDTLERSGATGLADVLARVPGIQITRNGGLGSTTSVFVRGANTQHAAVYIDGARVDTQSGAGGASWEAIPASQVDHIEVLRGPAAAIYGSDALAGVIQIFTRKGEGALAPYLSVGVGSHQTQTLEAGVSGATPTVDYAVNYARERSHGFNATTPGNLYSYVPDRDGESSQSLSGRVGAQLAPGQRVELTALDSHVNSQYDDSALTPAADDHSYRHLQVLGVNWLAHWSPVYQTRFSVTDEHDRYETAPSFYLTKTDVRSYLIYNELHLGAQTMTAALEKREDRLDSAAQPLWGTPALDQSRSQSGLALGYGLKWDQHSVQVNIRHDQDSEFGGKNTGSAAYAYGFAPGWRATTSVGTGFRAPTLYQRFSEYGEAGLRPESSRNVEFGLKYAQGTDSLSVVAYHSVVSNLISSVTTGPCVAGFYCYTNTNRATLQGVTVSGATRWAGVRFSGSLDLADPKDNTIDLVLARRARRTANLAADTHWADWQVGAESLWVSHRLDYSTGAIRPTTINPLGGYGLLNLYAQTRLSRDLSLLLRLNNVADKHYTLANGYATEGRAAYVSLKWAP